MKFAIKKHEKQSPGMNENQFWTQDFVVFEKIRKIDLLSKFEVLKIYL